jgi:hypothetical protein
MIIHCKYDIVFVQFLLCFLYVFFYNKACNWSIEFLQIVNISKLYHILGSNHSTFYVWSFQVSFPYKFLVLKMRTLLFMKYMWKMITFHCLPSSRCNLSVFRVWSSQTCRDRYFVAMCITYEDVLSRDLVFLGKGHKILWKKRRIRWYASNMVLARRKSWTSWLGWRI